MRGCYSAKFLLQAVILTVSPMDSLLAIYPTARKVEDLLKRQSRERCQIGRHDAESCIFRIEHLGDEDKSSHVRRPTSGSTQARLKAFRPSATHRIWR